MTNAFSWDRFYQMPLIGIMRHLPAQHLTKIAELYRDAGLTTLEITLNSAGAVTAIPALRAAFGAALNVGAGTVCSRSELDQALAAGAQFIVTPILNEEVIKASVAADIPIFPGAFTPTEIYQAWSWGASLVKVFPATKLGPAYIKDVLAPLNEMKLVPTGGVSLHNFPDYLKAGAHGVGIGSDLFPPKLIQNSKWDELQDLFLAYVKKYQQFKGLLSA